MERQESEGSDPEFDDAGMEDFPSPTAELGMLPPTSLEIEPAEDPLLADQPPAVFAPIGELVSLQPG